MPMGKGAGGLPNTEVQYQMVTLSDRNPEDGEWTTFTFPRRMIAWPLSKEGPPGFGPDNKADWWPYFQARHKVGLYWVQGHMLNDNIHGPGEPKNLVPISNTLNTNMLGIVERFVKDAVAKGEVVYYEVEAHWEGATDMQLAASAAKKSFAKLMGEMKDKSNAAIVAKEAAAKAAGTPNITFENPFAGASFTPTREMLHPAKMRQTYGLIDDAGDGALLWGEQFAPTRLSWKAFTSTNWQTAKDWVPGSHALKEIALSRGEAYWNNNFPGKAMG